uniref:Uncharacterized protein n=1 Tax=Arundo donax TaxID=35708 RepID=A0A0A9BDI1_ARUDO
MVIYYFIFLPNRHAELFLGYIIF